VIQVFFFTFCVKKKIVSTMQREGAFSQTVSGKGASVSRNIRCSSGHDFKTMMLGRGHVRGISINGKHYEDLEFEKSYSLSSEGLFLDNAFVLGTRTQGTNDILHIEEVYCSGGGKVTNVF